MSTTIIIADDHIVLREGLKALLNAVEGWQVVAEAGDGFELIRLVERHAPEIVLVDLSMPNLGGIETIARLQKLEKQTKVLVLSARDDESSVNAALKAGAKAYLPKTIDRNEMEFAIRAVLKGQTYLSPSICAGALHQPSESTEGNISSVFSLLSNREREIMKLLCEGHPNRNVAKLLHISPRTVDTHRSNIMKKLGISSNAELVQLAMKNGLVE